MTCYPDCGTTTTTFETAQHVVARHVTHALAFTGSDVIGWIIVALLLVSFGLLLLWACRAGWRRLG